MAARSSMPGSCGLSPCRWERGLCRPRTVSPCWGPLAVPGVGGSSTPRSHDQYRGRRGISLCPPPHTHVDNRGAGGSLGRASPAQLVLGRAIAAPALPTAGQFGHFPPSRVSLALHL